MRIDKLGIKNKRATIIFGAGASRGASCFNNSLLPAPLDADFFSVMQRVEHKDSILSDFMHFIRNEFGEGACPRMEELFTQLEALEEFHGTLNITRGPIVRRYGLQLAKFVEITATFFRHVYRDESGNVRNCDYHDALAKALKAGDTVISFNYDCLMDGALAAHGERSWSAAAGYGLPIEGDVSAWESTVAGPGRRASNPISLLKLHGSLNWDRSAGIGVEHIRLRPDPYSSANREKSEIVPPVWDKTIGGDEVYRKLWKEARRVLPTGPILVAVGYSVPPTDQLSRALVRVSASERANNQKLSHVIVANPDSESRSRFIDLVRSGMSSDTIVVELKSIAELKELLL